MAQLKTIVPPAVSIATELIEQKIQQVQVGSTELDQFGTGMVFGLRDALACLLQGVIRAGNEPK